MARDPRHFTTWLTAALGPILTLLALCVVSGCAGPGDAPAQSLATSEADTAQKQPSAEPRGEREADRAEEQIEQPPAPSRGPESVQGPPGVSFAEPVIYAFDGADLVMPLRVEADAPPDWWRQSRPQVVLSGRAVRATLVYMRADAPSSADANAAGWLGPGLRWRAWTVPGADPAADEAPAASEQSESAQAGTPDAGWP